LVSWSLNESGSAFTWACSGEPEPKTVEMSGDTFSSSMLAVETPATSQPLLANVPHGGGGDVVPPVAGEVAEYGWAGDPLPLGDGAVQ
jgi:hypothetical protein